MDPVVVAVRGACGVPVGVATGAWLEPDPERRAHLVGKWREPAFASANLSEEGAAEVMRALLDTGIGVEAGVWSPEDAERLASTGLAARVLRIGLEDTLILPDGSPAPSNAALVRAAVRIG